MCPRSLAGRGHMFGEPRVELLCDVVSPFLSNFSCITVLGVMLLSRHFRCYHMIYYRTFFHLNLSSFLCHNPPPRASTARLGSLVHLQEAVYSRLVITNSGRALTTQRAMINSQQQFCLILRI